MDFSTLEQSLTEKLLDPRYAEYLAVLKAARNGAVYGAKVRFPHALVMVFLFRSGTIQQKLHLILRATRQHATNLARFAFLYKLTLLLLRHLPDRGTLPTKERSADTFIAGLLGGYIVFGRGRGARSSVNQQIVIYVAARVALALAKLLTGSVRPTMTTMKSGGGHIAMHRLRDVAWPVFASLSWGGVMWIFRWEEESLQGSLRSSMKYIYVNADHWDGWRTFLWHNS